MMLLALDTTSEKGGVAIYRDHDCLAEVANEGPTNLYSVTLFQMLTCALESAGTKPHEGHEGGTAALHLADIELYAVANGPGSFTGIRIGAAATQGWARAFGRPVYGVSVLEALVESARPATEWAVPILDARRGEFFLGYYRQNEQKAQGAAGGFAPEGEGWVVKPEALKAFLQEHLPAGAEVTCVVREHDAIAQGLQETLPASFRWVKVSGTLLAAMARLALAAQAKGLLHEPGELNAYYIRRPDAEENWRA